MLVGIIGKGMLSFTTNLALAERNIDILSGNYSFQEIVNKSDIIYIATDTDTLDNYPVDNLDIVSLADQIGDYIESYKLIVIKSLVPVGTCEKLKSIIYKKIENRNSSAKFDIIYNPEFYDMDDSYIDIFADSISPSNIIIGIDNQKSLINYFNILFRLYDNYTLGNLNIMSIEASEIFAFQSVGMF